MAIVYLSGPMEDVKREDAGKWRKKSARKLKKKGHSVYDPMKREHMDFRTVVEADLYEIERSDIVLAHVPMGKHIRMIGTSMEIFYANRILRRPVIVWGHDCKNSHPWIFQNASKIFLPLEDAIDYIVHTF